MSAPGSGSDSDSGTSTSNSTSPPAPSPSRASESRAYQLTTALIICPIFASLLVALRIYTRLFIIRKRFWEDLSMVVALVFSIVMSVFNQLAVVYGSGRHFETITPPEYVEFLKVGIVITQVYSFTHLFLKLSILLQYVRISVTEWDRRMCKGLIAVLCTGYVVFIVLRMVRCVPIEAQWTVKLPGARCFFNSTWFMFASQAWNMVMDFVILVVPMVVLRHSRAPFLQRVLIGVVLAFGASACIISVFRLHTLYPSTTSTDPSWDKIPSAIFGIIEINVGIACASVVTLRPLYRRLREVVPCLGGKKAVDASGGPNIGAVARHSPGRQHPLVSDDMSFGTMNTSQFGSEGHREHDVEMGEGMPKEGEHRRSGSSSLGGSETMGSKSDTDRKSPESPAPRPKQGAPA